MMSGVSLKQVVKVYDNGIKCVHGVDLDIAEGEFVVFVGPSGCGKSTLLRMIAGLESISGGTISIGGKIVNDLAPRERDIAMVFQDYALYPHKNVFENLAFGLRLRKFSETEITKRVGEAASILRIEHLLDRKPRALSGGQRQRVAMGRAIVRQPKAFLFDEPLSNLDALLRSEMRTEIKKLHQRIGATTIYVTHDQVEAMTLAQRIVVLCAGNIMQIGTPDEIYNHPASKFVAGFTGSPPMNFLSGHFVETATGLCVKIGEDEIPIEPGPADFFAGQVGRKVSFGIRPEDVRLEKCKSADVVIQAQVIVTEPLGAETLVTLTTSSGDLVARLTSEQKLRSGQSVPLWLDISRTHVFDAESGEVLRA